MLTRNDRALGHPPVRLIVFIFLIALLSRIWAAWALPNPEQDGYSYAEIIAKLTQSFEAGQVQVSDLYGFWLPLFQIVAAVINLAIHDPLVAGKIINALCGATVAVLVFDVTRLLTGRIAFAVVAFAMIVSDPLHIVYSAGCMTDVPHGCLVLVSLCLALRRKWTLAAVAGALAGCIRVESWALIAVLPALQFICERRLSILPLFILLVPPLSWIAITFAATGHPLSYFHDRARYHLEYIDFHPERRGFQWPVIRQDQAYFLLGAGKLITIAAFAVAIGVIWNWIGARKPPNHRLLVTIGYYAGLLGLIVVAYVSKAQPVILPRYGLTFFALGLPLFGWSLQFLVTHMRSRVLATVFVLAVSAFFVSEMIEKLPTLGYVRDDFNAHHKIAAKLAQNMETIPGARCFSDDVAVRVLSRLPPERFLRTSFARRNRVTTAEELLGYLRSRDAQFLVYFPTEDSFPVKFFPELGRKEPPNDNRFEFLEFAPSSFGPDIWLYRLR
ncbi:MAG TPA: hypothetical protein VJ719_00380 [Chthoniobacterales bacterium]|nr:hypothetical protein [Chthoniobacterales bacterium]